MTKVINLKEIDGKLHSEFKAACAKNGKTLREVLIQMMEEYVKKNSK